ncbi:unnamed protein product [Effrenium voratum]|nr:unnamed protein product [Effrenium voratum]
MSWLLLLMLAPLAHAALRWGDPSCWRGWQNHQLCCYPQVRNVQELRVEEGFDACWTEGRNVSRCCRRSGAFFIVERQAPPAVKAMFRGCEALPWQYFLFKFRMAAGLLYNFDRISSQWFTYFDLEPLKSRGGEARGPCPVGQALYEFMAQYLAESFAPLPEQAFRRLQMAEMALAGSGGLFPAVGVTLEQLEHLRFLHALQNRLAGKRASPRIARHGASRAALAFDFGASGGVDTETLRRSGLQVVAVEGNARALWHLGSLRNVTPVHCAAGAHSAPPYASFEVDHHHGERSSVLADQKQEREFVVEEDSDVVLVPRRSCGSVYVDFAGPKGAEYAKIDLEGSDHDCLGSILRNSSQRPAPLFVSMEVQLANDNIQVMQSRAERVAQDLMGTLQGTYCWAKLCRQHIYNIRQLPGMNLVSRLGWGSSGLFGDLAVDWRVGKSWRPLPVVLAELVQAGLLSTMTLDWFDLHLKHC